MVAETNCVRILRRVNLGNYEHFEIDIIIYDVDEKNALKRAVELYEQAATALDIRERIDVRKLKER